MRERPCRVWAYPRGSWLLRRPIYFGSDEYCRRTIVLGNRWTGCVVIALWHLRDADDCPACEQRRSVGGSA